MEDSHEPGRSKRRRKADSVQPPRSTPGRSPQWFGRSRGKAVAPGSVARHALGAAVFPSGADGCTLVQALRMALAGAYSRAPEFDYKAERAWRSLAHWSTEDAAHLRRMYRVTETDNPQPYLNAELMFRDLKSGRLTVSRANSVHPLWTVEQNVDFRICHDVLGHYSASDDGMVADFTWDGEYNAARFHEVVLPYGST